MDTLIFHGILFWIVLIGAILLFYGMMHVLYCVCKILHGDCRRGGAERRLMTFGEVGKRHERRGTQRDQPRAKETRSETKEETGPRKVKKKVMQKGEEVEADPGSGAVRTVLEVIQIGRQSAGPSWVQ